MLYNVGLLPDNRIGSSSMRFHCGEGEIQFDFPLDFDFNAQIDYKIVEGVLVYDPLPEPEPQETPPTLPEINAANIDYIAMIQDIELPTQEV